MLKARIKKMEEIVKVAGPHDPYAHLSYEEVLAMLKKSNRETYKLELKKNKARAQEFKQLFIDTEDDFYGLPDPSKTYVLTGKEKVEILQKQLEWELKDKKDENVRQRIIENYQSHIEHAQQY